MVSRGALRVGSGKSSPLGSCQMEDENGISEALLEKAERLCDELDAQIARVVRAHRAKIAP